MAVAGSYTAEALISSVRRRGMFPPTDDGSSFPRDADILAIVNEEVSGYLAPLINAARQGQFITHVDIPVNANQSAYPVPARALGAEISSVQVVDANGNPLYPALAWMDLETATKWPWNNASFGQPLKYYFEGDSIVLVPTPLAGNQSLRIFYPQRPNQLVPATSVLPITSFAGGAPAGRYRLGFTAAAPSGFTTSATYESISQDPSFAKTTLGVPTALTGTYVEFAGTQPGTIQVGDTLVLQDTANVLTGVSADLFGLVAQWAVVKLKETREDAEALQRAESVYEKQEKRLKELLGKRVQLAHRKVSAAQNRPWGRMPPFFAR